MHSPLILALTLAAVGQTHEDWPQWRGPRHDALSRDSAWSDQGQVLWRVDVGLGHSAASIVGDRVFTLGFDAAAEVDRVRCLDAATGEEVWSQSYPAALRDQNHTGGTQTTPAVADGRVFVSSREGELRSYDAATGALHWELDVAASLECDPGLYGFSGSPLVHGDLVVVNAGSVVAVERESGTTRWATEPLEAQFSTPTPFVLAGQECLAIFTEAAVEVLAAEDGARLHAYPWRPKPRGVNASTPIVVGEHLLVSSAYERGVALLSFQGEEPEALWANRRMRNKMAGCVRVGDLVFGFDESMFKCLDVEGNERWRVRGLGNGAVSAAGDRLLVTTSRGELVVARATGDEFLELSRTKLFEEGTFWTPPSIAAGRIYVRNGLGQLACVDHRPRELEQAGIAADAPRDRAEYPSAESLFARHLELVGGAAALRALESCHQEGTFEMRSVGFKPVRFSVDRQAPNLYHAEIGFPAPIEGAMHRIFDGEVAFELNQYLGNQVYAEGTRREYAETAGLAALAHMERDYASLETKGSAEFGDRPCWRVDAVSKLGNRRSFFFARDTGHCVGRDGPDESAAIFADYQRFGDVSLPTLERYFQSETGIEEIWRIETVEFGQVDPEVFQRPEAIDELLREAQGDPGDED